MQREFEILYQFSLDLKNIIKENKNGYTNLDPVSCWDLRITPDRLVLETCKMWKHLKVLKIFKKTENNYGNPIKKLYRKLISKKIAISRITQQ